MRRNGSVGEPFQGARQTVAMLDRVTTKRWKLGSGTLHEKEYEFSSIDELHNEREKASRGVFKEGADEEAMRQCVRNSVWNWTMKNCCWRLEDFQAVEWTLTRKAYEKFIGKNDPFTASWPIFYQLNAVVDHFLVISIVSWWLEEPKKFKLPLDAGFVQTCALRINSSEDVKVWRKRDGLPNDFSSEEIQAALRDKPFKVHQRPAGFKPQVSLL
ncbi:hypothetical protein T439DRAFT_331462 [Meredithblackwellia eburnea MCA 4105]